jgi:hypothetical protein
MNKDLDRIDTEIDDRNDREEDVSFKEQQIMLLPERAAFERAGVPRVFEILRTMIDSSGEIGKRLEDLNRKIFRINLSDEDRFKIFMAIFYQKYREDLNLNDNDLDQLVLLMEKVPNIGKKNPYAFVLGYYVLANKRISKKRFETVAGIINSIEEVALPDVIRYAKLIQRI